MIEPSLPLTSLPETQRTQVLERFAILQPALEEGLTQAQIARAHDLSKSSAGTLRSQKSAESLLHWKMRPAGAFHTQRPMPLLKNVPDCKEK